VRRVYLVPPRARALIALSKHNLRSVARRALVDSRPGKHQLLRVSRSMPSRMSGATPSRTAIGTATGRSMTTASNIAKMAI